MSLSDAQLPHNFGDDGPPFHCLRWLAGCRQCWRLYIRHMDEWGAQVLLTGETVPVNALQKIIAGEALADTLTSPCAVQSRRSPQSVITAIALLADAPWPT